MTELEFIAKQEAKGYYAIKHDKGVFFVHKNSQAGELVRRIEAKKKAINESVENLKKVFNGDFNPFAKE